VRAYLPDYEAIQPSTLAEALQRLAAEPGAWTPLAGGTDVMVMLEAGQLKAKKLMSLWRLKELRGINYIHEPVLLGALTTYADLQRQEILKREFPSLTSAGFETGGLAIQNRGTIGGNVANASPAADTPPALLAYDAEVEAVSVRGARWIPYASFHLGYKKTALAPDELIRAVRMPRPRHARHHFYRKVGTRRAQAISKVVFAAVAEQDGGGYFAHVRIALGSVAPVTLRLPMVERMLTGQPLTEELKKQAIAALRKAIAPIDDVRSTAVYRSTVAGNVLRQFLDELG